MTGVVILGMHRSGTSLVADLVHKWGAHPGEGPLSLGDEWNREGYWESEALVSFNDELLQRIGASWLMPPGPDDDQHLHDLAQSSDFAERARTIVDSLSAGGTRVWFCKDPRLALLLPFWRRIWGDVVYVTVNRHPAEIALSLLRRNHIPVVVSLLVWQRTWLCILEQTFGIESNCLLQYDRLVRDPAGECHGLCGFLERAVGCHSAPTAAPTMAARVQPELQHQRVTASFQARAEATVRQKELYRYLRTRDALTSGEWRGLDLNMDAGWRDHLRVFEAMQQLWSYIPMESRDALSGDMPRPYRELFGF